MMNSEIIQLIACGVGNLGFSIVFGVRKEMIPLTTAGGVLTWASYLFIADYIQGYFLPYFLATLVAGVYSEVMARIAKAPSIIFLILAVVPLIPGGSLFYTMFEVVHRRDILIGFYGHKTASYALGIACGISLVWSTVLLTRNIKMKMISQNKKI